VAAPDPSARRPVAVDLTYVGHATVLLEVAGLRILTDPFLRRRLGPLVRHGPLPEPGALDAVDIVLISHGHPDHFDRRSLQFLSGTPLVVVPRGLRARAARWTSGEVVELEAGEETTVRGIRVEATPARHWITPGSPRAQPQGYLLHAGARVWFAGDSGRFDGLSAVYGRVDVAMLPVWTWGPHLGPGHLGPRSAAEVLIRTGATTAIPIHWGTLYPRRLHRVWRSPLTEPGYRFAAHVARLAPSIDVRVLRPGDATTIISPQPA
jgi:L-ascorbate metabolism protein UlaG (beta-lactamase superfamily)